MASDNEIDHCLAVLAVVYPSHFKSWTTPEQIRVARRIYHQIWQSIDGDLLEAAALQWLSTARPFHPSPGELRDLALSLIEQGNGDLSADEAWAEVLQQMHNPGYYGVPIWSSETIAETMKSFGRWKDFCIVDIDQLPFVRSQFMKIYEAQRARRHEANLMLPEVKKHIAQIGEQKRHALNAPAES